MARPRYRSIPYLGVALLAAGLLLVGCSARINSEPGGGEPAGGEPGVGKPDGGAPDRGMADGGAPDSNAPDGRLVGCKPAPAAGTFWSLSATDRDTGKPAPLCEHRGRVALVVNVAAN